MDLITTGAAGACGALLGAAVGFYRGRRAGRRQPHAAPDLKLRLKARDDDVAAAEARAADVTVRLEAIGAELARARTRLAELEPAPGAPAPPDRGNGAAAPVDDLTLVPGLGPREAAVLEASGVTSFDSLAELGADGAVIPEGVADQLADRLSEWAAEARRLAGRHRRDPE
jgi:predicted flap endonuclease-1-like 5' DNA nuclease